MIKSFYELPAIHNWEQKDVWASHLYWQYEWYCVAMKDQREHYCVEPPKRIKKDEVSTFAAGYKFIFEQPIDQIINFMRKYAQNFTKTVNKVYLICMLEDIYEAWKEEIAAL